MNFLIENWMLVAVAASSALALFWPAMTKGAANGVQPTEAVLLMNREKAVVVDVCSAEEYAAGHVAGAKNVPLGDLEAKLAGVVKNKTNPLILVCASGVRSKRAVAVAKKLGFENAHSLTGGTAAWRAASLPVEKA